jgi:antitoxin (DNA-binding transcriptional repressor) of toxin-antitoxin stability system
MATVTMGRSFVLDKLIHDLTPGEELVITNDRPVAKLVATPPERSVPCPS